MELTPKAEAENLIFKLTQRADLLLRAGADDMEEYAWTLKEIARLQRSTGATQGIERKKTNDRTA